MTYTKEYIEEIWNDKIKNNLTTKQVQEKYFKSIDYWFRKYEFVDSKKAVRHKENHIKWSGKTITSEIEAYIVGLLYSDGFVVPACIETAITLTNKDGEYELLTKINNYILSNPKELKIDSKNKIRLRIYSTEFCNNMIDLGVLPNKTYKELHIPKMNENLIRHFIRGYFDGDGTVFYDRKYLKSNICSINKIILEEIQKHLTNEGIESSIDCEIRKGKKLYNPQGNSSENYSNMYRLYIRKQSALKAFKDYLYKDCTICLKRKHEKFENTELT